MNYMNACVSTAVFDRLSESGNTEALIRNEYWLPLRPSESLILWPRNPFRFELNSRLFNKSVEVFFAIHLVKQLEFSDSISRLLTDKSFRS